MERPILVRHGLFVWLGSEYYVWSADLSGRQSRTHANLKVRAPKPAKNPCESKGSRSLKNYACGKKRRLSGALLGAPDFSQAWSFCVVVSEYYVWSADLSGRQSKTHANLKVRAPKPAK